MNARMNPTMGAIVKCARCGGQIELLTPGILDTRTLRGLDHRIARGQLTGYAQTYKASDAAPAAGDCPVCGFRLTWPEAAPAAKAAAPAGDPWKRLADETAKLRATMAKPAGRQKVALK